ncbi:MAG: BatD family protein [Chitinophagaceae bacterium]
MYKHYWIGLFGLLSLQLVTGFCYAQEVSFSTETAAKKVGIKDAFEVRYIIKNAQRVEQFHQPQFEGFEFLGGPDKRSSISIINGQRSVSYEISYILRAKKLGKLVVPGAKATIRGREIKSNAVSIEVIPGSVQSRQQDPFADVDPFADLFDDDMFGEDPFVALQKKQQQMMQQWQRMMQQKRNLPNLPSHPRNATSSHDNITKDNLYDNIFIRVDADKQQVVKGEQVTVSYKLYTRVPMEINLTKLPSLNGFWSQDFKLPQVPKPTREIFNGKEYQVFEIKRSALFPTQTGTLQLDEAEAAGIARVLKPRTQRNNESYDDPIEQLLGSLMMSDPDFDQGFLSQADFEEVQVKLKSKPLAIQVNALPTDTPPNFQQAVGKYTLETTIDKTELTTDDVVKLNVRISGTGNLKLIQAPHVTLPSELDMFSPEEHDTITNTNNIIAGYKTFTYHIAPLASGSFQIPPVQFSYYDPELQQFQTIEGSNYTIVVKPGKDYKNNKNKALKEIHDIHTDVQITKSNSLKPLYKNPIYWSGFGLPLLAYLGLLFYKRKQDDLASNTVLFKNKKANKIALKRLAIAEKYLQEKNNTAFYEETSKAIWLYLSDKLNIPLANLSKEKAMNRLQNLSVPDDLQLELIRLTNECETALYSPDRATMHMHQTYSDAFKLIGKLEDFLSA